VIDLVHLKVGCVLEENDDFITLKVIKDHNRDFQVEPTDQFLTLNFVHLVQDSLEAWTPWEEINGI
jgi:hypothetical protein